MSLDSHGPGVGVRSPGSPRPASAGRRASASRRALKKVVIAEVEPNGDGDGRGGCPFHFGIRTYFSSIVEPPEKEIIETVDYLEESDFDDRKRSCSWEKACIWCGVPLLIIGVVAVLVGQFMPTREVLLRKGSVTYLDRRAIAYNHRLEVARLAGLAALCTAALMILLSFLLSAYNCPSVNPGAANTGQHDYCPVFMSSDDGRIPVSGVLTTVQPPASPIHLRR